MAVERGSNVLAADGRMLPGDGVPTGGVRLAGGGAVVASDAERSLKL